MKNPEASVTDVMIDISKRASYREAIWRKEGKLVIAMKGGLMFATISNGVIWLCTFVSSDMYGKTQRYAASIAEGIIEKTYNESLKAMMKRDFDTASSIYASYNATRDKAEEIYDSYFGKDL